MYADDLLVIADNIKQAKRIDKKVRKHLVNDLTLRINYNSAKSNAVLTGPTPTLRSLEEEQVARPDLDDEDTLTVQGFSDYLEELSEWKKMMDDKSEMIGSLHLTHSYKYLVNAIGLSGKGYYTRKLDLTDKLKTFKSTLGVLKNYILQGNMDDKNQREVKKVIESVAIDSLWGILPRTEDYNVDGFVFRASQWAAFETVWTNCLRKVYLLPWNSSRCQVLSVLGLPTIQAYVARMANKQVVQLVKHVESNIGLDLKQCAESLLTLHLHDVPFKLTTGIKFDEVLHTGIDISFQRFRAKARGRVLMDIGVKNIHPLDFHQHCPTCGEVEAYSHRILCRMGHEDKEKDIRYRLWLMRDYIAKKAISAKDIL